MESKKWRTQCKREKGESMAEFKLKSHIVEETSFVENIEKEKRDGIEINVDGNALVPREINKEKKIAVKLIFRMGKQDERLYFVLKTLTIFEVDGNCEQPVTEAEVHEKCFPVALGKLRNTVTKVLEAYGKSGISLPPFIEE